MAFFILTKTAKAETTNQKIMPKSFYANETDIPENLKGGYEAKNGRWELTKLDDEHPTIITNKSLNKTQGEQKTQIDNLTATNGNLERERDEAKAKSIPSGFRAVSKEIAELGEAVKSVNLSKDEVAALKTENDKFKSAAAETTANALRREAGKFLGYQNEDAFARLAKDLELVKDGDKFSVKVGDKTELLTKEFVEKSETFAPFIRSLNEKNKKTPFPESGGGTGENIYDNIRESVKKQADAPKVDIDARFGRPATV